MKSSYRIPERNFEKLQGRIEKLNRRCKRIGFAPIVVTTTGEEFLTLYVLPDGRHCAADSIARMGLGPVDQYPTIINKWILIDIEGESPKYNGWEFVATLQHEEGGNILRTVAGFEGTMPEEYRSKAPWCEYCKIDRGWKDTYVIRHESGEWKQVGRNCIRDFLGHANPHQLAEYAEILIDLQELCEHADDDEYWGGGYAPSYHLMHEFVSASVTCIRSYGWRSRKTAREYGTSATADDIELYLDPKVKRISNEPKPEMTETDKAEADKAIEWARNIPADLNSDYLWNLRTACANDYVGRRLNGIVASLIPAYRKAMEKEIERRKRFEDGKNSQHFGEIGKRGEYELTLTFSKQFENEYGISTLMKFMDRAGNVAVWWASGGKDWQQGETFKVKATIKGHDEYQGVKQTALTRVSEIVEPVCTCDQNYPNIGRRPGDEIIMSENCMLKDHKKQAKKARLAKEKAELAAWEQSRSAQTMDAVPF